MSFMEVIKWLNGNNKDFIYVCCQNLENEITCNPACSPQMERTIFLSARSVKKPFPL